jgi:hypothetical protein
MAIIQISQIQLRRGLNQDLPQLASAEMGWSLDTQQLFIGNGSLSEGAPAEGVTEILTEHSNLLGFLGTYTFEGLSAGYQVETGPDALHPVVRSVQDKLDDIVSVRDFGAVGDGVTDDTAAIQRAMLRVFATNQRQLLLNHHRTIYFPAGQYNITSTLNIPPYIRLQGEGKRTTIITGSFAGPLAQFADSFGQTGVSYAQSDQNGNLPDFAEYHLSDLAFQHLSPLYNQSCLQIDGCFTATFHRCMFRGLTEWTQPDSLLPQYGNGNGAYYTSNRGPGVAGVYLSAQSGFTAIRNVTFIQCDFFDINYGIEIENECLGVSVAESYFDHNYHNIAINTNSVDPNYIPTGITIEDNYFRYSAAEAIYCGSSQPGSTAVMSLGNYFTGAGYSDGESDSPIINTAVLAYTYAITFHSNNNFSIGDSFQRGDADYLITPTFNTNGYMCTIVAQDFGITTGKRTDGLSRTITLADAASFTSVGAVYIPTEYTNLTMEYTLNHASNQRTGSFRVNRTGSTYIYDEEYNETGASGSTLVTFRANPTSGDIEYVSTSSGGQATLTYRLNFYS